MQNFEIDKVIVVDNASSDNSQNVFCEFKYSYELIQNVENEGFAFACNQGACGCMSDYILFLNPDTMLYVDTMEKLTDFLLTKDSSIGIVGIQLLDEYNRIAKTCSRFPSNIQKLCKIFGFSKLFPSTSASMLEWAHNESRIVDQVIGAFFVVETELFKKLNGFDERFFMYYEEVDFSKRAYNIGKKSYYFAEARAFHKGGGTSEQVLDKRLFYVLSSFLKYQKKHNGIMAMYIALFLEFLEYFSRFILLIFKSKGTGINKLNSAYKMLFSNLKHILINKNKLCRM